MGIQLNESELAEFLEKGHTLILATLRKSGEPFLTPLWYAYHEGAIYFSTRAESAKVRHIKRDPRVCCMVEEGQRWIDLKAAVINCTAELIEDHDMKAKVAGLTSEKYAAFRPNIQAAPKATRKHYSASSALVKLTPIDGEVRSWYNRKIRGMGDA